MSEAANIPARLLDTAKGRLFAEWSLLLQDLRDCLKVAELWRTKSQEGGSESDLVIAASLFRDAVVRFMACFDRGMSVRLDADELYAPPHTKGGIEFVAWLSSLRDTWIAHRHGVSRQAYATVFVAEGTGELIGVGELIVALVSYDYDKASGFIKLIQIAIAYAETRKDELHQEVLGEARSLQPAQLQRLPIAEATVPAPQTLHMGRVKFHRIKRSSKRR